MSNRSKGWKSVLIRIIGIFLGIAGLGMGYFWYYHLGPLRHYYDRNWCRQHSVVAVWEEYQKCVYRSGWEHDGFSQVGQFGDKHWVEWIMEHIRPGDDIRSCSAGHKSHGLRLLTNQDAGDSAEAWLAWWRLNKSKSQEDWIREGFRKFGIELHNPLTQANIISLLRLMPYPEEGKEGTPDHIQYNAFRWLRDSDFDPYTFAVKDIPAKNADQVLQGLIGFARKSGALPKGYQLGVLNLGASPRDYDWQSEISTLRHKTLVSVAIFVPLCTSLLLLLISFRVFSTGRIVEFLKIPLLAISAAVVYFDCIRYFR